MLVAFAKKMSLTLDMIKFSHSVFALPFALASALFAANGLPEPREIALLVICMVTARNSAMTFNRIADRHIDAMNPRTKNRPLPAGTLSLKFSVVFCVINAVLFIATAAQFNRLTFLLAPVALALICGYSLTKRLTHYTQVFLGSALGIAPIAAWIALTGAVAEFPLWLGISVALWVAGFDLVYSCLDYDFDTRYGVKNLAARLGIPRALILSRILHALCVATFAMAGASEGVGAWFFAGLGVISLCLVYEHRLVRADDLSRVNAAFFTMNGYVALLFLGFSAAEVFSRKF